VEIQSFEVANLRYLRGRIGTSSANLKLMQLVGDPRRVSPDEAAAGGNRRRRREQEG
jgi:glycerophosphoryl diester phosphodiesterase